MIERTFVPGTVDELLDAAEERLGELCGQMNVIVGEMTHILAAVSEREAWGSTGCRSFGQWVEWICGVSPTQAKALIDVAGRRGELVEMVSLLDEGRLSVDQVAAVASGIPDGKGAEVDAEFAELASVATVRQIRKAVRTANVSNADLADADGRNEQLERPASMTFGFDEDGRWRCMVDAPAADAAGVDNALRAGKDALYQRWKRSRDEADKQAGSEPVEHPPVPTNFDALCRMAELAMVGEIEERPHYARTRTIIHVDAETDAAHLHLGPALSAAERTLLTCDGTWEVWLEKHGVPIGAGRTSRKVPDRLRIYVDERDGGMCRNPRCFGRVGLHLHHIQFWTEDKGPTESWNLASTCPHCHRRIHSGELQVSGNADEPDGLTWTDQFGRLITGASAARPPTESPPAAWYAHPTGERMNWYWYTPPSWN